MGRLPRALLLGAIGRPLFWLLVFALVIALSASKFRPAKADNVAKVNPYRPETIIPYTVRLKEDLFDKTGKLTWSGFETYAVRTDGSTVLVSELNGNTSRMIDFASKAIVRTSDERHLRSSISVPRLPFLRNPALSCSVPKVEQPQGFEYVGNYRAVKIRGGLGTSWYGIDNGCALLQAHVAFTTGEVNDKSLISLEMGEPEQSLFEVPQSYREVAPSILGEIRNPTIPPWPTLDHEYYQHRLTRVPQ
jgi:hypothetical protein